MVNLIADRRDVSAVVKATITLRVACRKSIVSHAIKLLSIIQCPSIVGARGSLARSVGPPGSYSVVGGLLPATR